MAARMLLLRWDSGSPRLSASHIHALARVSVSAGEVAAPVDHAEHGLDAESVIAHGPVPGESRRAALDVEAVVSRPPCEIAYAGGCGGPCF